MNKFQNLVVCILLNLVILGLLSPKAWAQTANLRLSAQLDCASGQYLATLQIRASDATSFSIGTSSVFLTYNPSSLTFVNYQSLNFDNNTLCGGQSLWDSHSFDGSSPGQFNLTMVLNSSSVSCPLITNTDWVSIGTIRFSVLNPNGNPSLQFSTAFSIFNAVPANNGSIQIQQGQYVGVDQLGVLNCPTTPVCSLTATAAPGICNTTSNRYTLTGTVNLSNAVAGNLTISDGNVSVLVPVAANQASASFSLTGLASDGVMHTVSASLSGCGTGTTTTYTAPQSCTVTPCPAGDCFPIAIDRIR
jgi:hypothetical protein